MQARFDDADVGLDDLGNFVELEAFVFEQDEGFALEVGELGDHLGDDDGEFLIHAVVGDVEGAVGVGGVEVGVVVAITLERKVTGDGEEERFEVAAGGVPAVRVAEEGQEAVLGDVFGEVGAAAGEAVDEAVDGLVVIFEGLLRWGHITLSLLGYYPGAGQRYGRGENSLRCGDGYCEKR